MYQNSNTKLLVMERDFYTIPSCDPFEGGLSQSATYTHIYTQPSDPARGRVRPQGKDNTIIIAIVAFVFVTGIGIILNFIL